MAETIDTEDVDPMFNESKMIADKIQSHLISDGAMNFYSLYETLILNDITKTKFVI